MNIRAFSLCLLLWPLLASTSDAQPTQVARGVTYEFRTLPGPRRAHITTVNLCASGVRIRATAPGEGPRTTSSFASLVGATAAINGDWWGRDGNPRLPDTIPRGLSLGNRTHFTQTADPPFYGFMAFGFNRAEASKQEEAVGQPQGWMHEVVSGQPTILADGVVRDSGTNGHCARNPRTITGLSADKTTFYMVVVDGRRSSSIGMTCNEAADFMQSLGASDALIQDGGGSSTMWVSGRGVVNNPSDGSQRSVVNHWGIIAQDTGPPHACVTREIPTPANGIRRGVTGAGFANWNFQWEDVIPVSDNYISRFTRGSNLPDSPIVVKAAAPAIFVLDGTIKRRVPNPRSMRAWKFPNPASRTQAQLDAIYSGERMVRTPVLVKGTGATVWLLDMPEPTCADVEACNGQDDDCDVKVDEGCVMDAGVDANLPDASVDASIPDATLMDATQASDVDLPDSRFAPDVPILDARVGDPDDASSRGDLDVDPDPGADGGCGCHLARHQKGSSWYAVLMAGAVLRRRRKTC